MKLTIVRRTRMAVDGRRVRPFLRRICDFLDAPKGDVTLLLCDDEEIAALNGSWRGKPRPTDVLSFPGSGATAEGRVHLGDLAISVETAARAARQAGHTLAREMERLLAHGVLHLLGFDHETDDGTMLRIEARALAAARGRRAAGRSGPGALPSVPAAKRRGPVSKPSRRRVRKGLGRGRNPASRRPKRRGASGGR